MSLAECVIRWNKLSNACENLAIGKESIEHVDLVTKKRSNCNIESIGLSRERLREHKKLFQDSRTPCPAVIAFSLVAGST
jgi:hypothetical protein